jgi:hypothetical protein
MKAILVVSKNEHGVQATLERSCGCDWCWRGTKRQFATALGTEGASKLTAELG